MTSIGTISLIAVLMASLAGSGHCVPMCGGFVFAARLNKSSLWAYHLSRLLAYLSLGAIAGWIGNQFLFQLWHSPLAAGVAILFSVTLILVTVFFSLGKLPLSPFLHRMNHRWIGRLENLNARAIALGLGSALLPCSWLYGFVLLAITSHQPLFGFLILGTFWLGTLPAHLMSQFALKTLVSRGLKLGRGTIIGLTLAVNGASIVFHWISLSALDPNHATSGRQIHFCLPTQK